MLHLKIKNLTFDLPVEYILILLIVLLSLYFHTQHLFVIQEQTTLFMQFHYEIKQFTFLL